MSGIKQAELDIYCEDEFSQELITLALPNELRLRVNVVEIGSAAAVIRQLAARFKDTPDRASCGILDGDQSRRKADHVRVFLGALEKVKDGSAATDWIENRLTFLPEDRRPEHWVFSKLENDVTQRLADDFGVSVEELKCHVTEAIAQDHTGLHLLSTKLSLPPSTIRTRLIRAALRRSEDEASKLADFARRLIG